MSDDDVRRREGIVSKSTRSAVQFSLLRLCEIGRLGRPPCTVANVEHFNVLPFFHDTVDHPIDVRFVSIKQVSQLAAFSCDGAPARMIS